MLPQLFAITYAFHPQRRRGSRIAPRHFTVQSSSEVEEHCAVWGRMSQHSARLSAPSAESRANTIAQLRGAVESGTYCVSAEQIAEKIAQEILADMFT
jgi:anti-sigma28 factor (negative regulator of flagellin synthesis)